MSISILTESNYPEVSKLKKDFNIHRVVDTKKGKLEMIEFFNKDGVFRGFGKSTKGAFKRAKKAAKRYYKELGEAI